MTRPTLRREQSGQAPRRRQINVAYLVTHPIQYQAPLLRQIARLPGVRLKVFFQSDVSTRAFADPGFGQAVEWDIPLTDGYEHVFLPPLFGSTDKISVWRPFSRGLIKHLVSHKTDILWIHGYNRPYNIMTLIMAMAMGMRVMLRDEPENLKGLRRGPAEVAKRLYIGLFSRFGGRFLAIGTANAQYFKSLGMRDDRVFIAPYSVDNAFFQQRIAAVKDRRQALRTEIGISDQAPIILYASKFIRRKHPDVLLQAYADVATRFAAQGKPAPHLVFAGSGEMLEEVKARAAQIGGGRVYFLGFQNQKRLPALYELCDVFVLPSSQENWGLVVNEAMNAAKPVIVTDEVACHPDLVRPGENGHVVPPRDSKSLAEALYDVLGTPGRAEQMGLRSLEVINAWGYDEMIEAFEAALANMFPAGGRPLPTTAERPFPA